jgi:2-keto-4-pentenoate hydratase
MRGYSAEKVWPWSGGRPFGAGVGPSGRIPARLPQIKPRRLIDVAVLAVKSVWTPQLIGMTARASVFRRCSGQLASLLALLAAFDAAAWSTLDDWATVVASQIESRQSLPVLSAYGIGLTLPEAYFVQRQVVQRLAKPVAVAGFRAALTRPRGQVAFNVQGPVTGVIFKAGVLRGAPALSLRQFPGLTIAPGLAFLLRARIAQPLASADGVESLVSAVFPVIDLANEDFERKTQVSATDLVAGNAAFGRVLLGKPLPDTRPETFNGVLVELAHQSRVIDRGRGVNLMGDQRNALRWLINTLLAQGWELPAGTLLMTGGLSDPVPAKPGEYIARYWDLDTLTFRVIP